MKEHPALLNWTLFCLILSAVCATVYPIAYVFSGWYKYSLGRAVMAQAIALATAIDLTLAFNLWKPDNVILLFWTNAIVFTLLAVTTAYLTWHMLNNNYIKPYKARKKRIRDRQRLHS